MRLGVALALATSLLASATATAEERELRVVPGIFDPGDTDGIISRWVPFSGHGHRDPAIIMAKTVPTAVDAAAVAAIEGVRGLRLNELGFDVFNGGHCGAGAPRVNVTTVDGTIYFFGCFYGTHEPAPDKKATFTRVRFNDGSAFPQKVTDPPWPGFGNVRVRSLEIVFDEGSDQGSGFTAIDDIDVNGKIVERPGDDD
jgi:hypothetical protein